MGSIGAEHHRQLLMVTPYPGARLSIRPPAADQAEETNEKTAFDAVAFC